MIAHARAAHRAIQPIRNERNGAVKSVSSILTEWQPLTASVFKAVIVQGASPDDPLCRLLSTPHQNRTGGFPEEFRAPKAYESRGGTNPRWAGFGLWRFEFVVDAGTGAAVAAACWPTRLLPWRCTVCRFCALQ